MAEGELNPGAALRRVERLEADRRRIERELAGRDEVRGLDELRAFPPGVCSACGVASVVPEGPKGGPLCREHAVAAGRADEEDKDGKYACPDGPGCPDPDCRAENERRGVLKAAGKGATIEWSSSPLVRVKVFPDSQRRAELEARRAAIVDEVGHLRARLEESGAHVWGPKDFAKGQRIAETGHGSGTIVRVSPKSLTVRLDKAPGGCEAFREIKVQYDRLAHKGCK